MTPPYRNVLIHTVIAPKIRKPFPGLINPSFPPWCCPQRVCKLKRDHVLLILPRLAVKVPRDVSV